MFSKEYEFRYSDLDRRGEIKPCSVIDLLQDISIEHCASIGYPTEKLMELQIACLLDGWRIWFDKKLSPYEKVTVKTGIMSVSAIETLRKYEIWQGGECKIIASAAWFTVDTSKMRIIRVPDAFKNDFESISEEDNGLPVIRFKPEKDIEAVDNTKVERRDLDTNNHMNNVKSAQVCVDGLPEDFSFNTISIKYRKELSFGEEIEICRKTDETGCHIELKNSAGDVCVMMKAGCI